MNQASWGPSKAEDRGFLARASTWWNGDQVFRARPSQQGASGVPDFLAQTESPDRRRHRPANAYSQAAGRPDGPSLEQEWRRQCHALASSQDLSHVRDMRIAYLVPDCQDVRGNLVLVVVAAHYKGRSVLSEELLVYIVQELRKVGSRSFVVVYFNADAPFTIQPFTVLPDTTFMQQLHAALPAAYTDQLQAIYVVHPTATVKAWIGALRIRCPDIYGRKVVHCRFLSDLYRVVSPDELLDIPEHVQDKDLKRLSEQ